MAESKKKRARYRRTRDDVFGHPKTGGMRLQAYGLMFYATSQNLLGVMQQSARAIAARFGNSAGEVREIIKLLTTPRNGCAPIAMWWPEIETLWIIEALDEQSDGDMVDRAAAKMVATLPAVVRAAIIERYGERVLGTLPGEGMGGGSGEGVSPQESGAGIRTQEQEPGSTPNPASGGRSRSSSGITTETRAEAEHVGGFALTEPKPSKPKVTAKPRKPRADLPDGLAEHVLAELVRACRELDGPTAGPRHNAQHEPFLDALRKLHAAHMPTPEDWTAVILERQRLTQEGDTFGSLTIASLCVPANFERWLARSRARTRGGPTPPTRGPSGPAPASPRPTESRTVIVRRGGSDDGQAGAA